MALIPPFCPDRNCAHHQKPRARDWYRPFGWYHTRAHGQVRRFACRACGKSFSEQTFRLSYYLHRNIDFRDILFRHSSCSSVRAMARAFRVTDKVIANRIARLARQAIGVMAGLRLGWHPQEALAADGFESFIRSQYSPNNIHHLVGAESQYVLACDLAHLRRKGRMTGSQRRKREMLELSDVGTKGEIESSFERLCHVIEEIVEPGDLIVLHTDEKREYRTVLRANRYCDGRVEHKTTSSRKARTRKNPLWPVNYHDREIRKDQASHVRETTRWAQEANHCMERIYAYAGYHNFFKPFRIKERDVRTHAELAGCDQKAMGRLLKSFFTRRHFFTRLVLNASEWLVWLRAYRTMFRPGIQYLPGFFTGEERRMPQTAAA